MAVCLRAEGIYGETAWICGRYKSSAVVILSGVRSLMQSA